MREAAGAKPEKKEKSRFRKGQERTISFTISQQFGHAMMGTWEHPC